MSSSARMSASSSSRAADAALDAAYIDVVGAVPKEGMVESIRSVAVAPQDLSVGGSPTYSAAIGASSSSSSSFSAMRDRGTPSPASNYQPYGAPYPLPHLQQTSSPQLIDISAAPADGEELIIEGQVHRPPSVPIKIEVSRAM